MLSEIAYDAHSRTLAEEETNELVRRVFQCPLEITDLLWICILEQSWEFNLYLDSLELSGAHALLLSLHR